MTWLVKETTITERPVTFGTVLVRGGGRFCSEIKPSLGTKSGGTLMILTRLIFLLAEDGVPSIEFLLKPINIKDATTEADI